MGHKNRKKGIEVLDNTKDEILNSIKNFLMKRKCKRLIMIN